MPASPNSSPGGIGGLVLAAGEGRPFGGPKQPEDLVLAERKLEREGARFMP